MCISGMRATALLMTGKTDYWRRTERCVHGVNAESIPASACQLREVARLLQAGQLAGKVRELEAKLAASQQQSGQLSAAVEQEQQKIRFYFGHDLEQLGWENLQELEQFHQSRLSRLLPPGGRPPGMCL